MTQMFSVCTQLVCLFLVWTVTNALNFGTVTTSFYSDPVTCSTSSYQGSASVVSGKCNHMTNSESGWPWIRWTCDSTITTCIYSTSYTDASCTVPNASHYNYCNECKANVLRTCNGLGGNASVTYWNCTDDQCTTCSPLVTVPVTGVLTGASQCSANPLPQLISGSTLSIHSVMQCVALNHSWWTGTNCGEGPGQFGSDLIVLNQCNNGWMFECLP
mmetsp:Transcript_33953/g.39545  ORF Transcript_33953/g.39545 Transcript_33953/m.39545 type:complete len:216 (-) Transcript_33953:75-722(-)